MSHLLDALLAGPALPGTILLGVCAVYWLMLIAGAVDLDLFDFDLDADADPGVDHGGSGWGMTALKFLNIDDVPLMIWLTPFAAGYVAAGVAVPGSPASGDWLGVAAAVARSGAVGLVAAKLLTQPLKGKFETVEPNVAETLVGRTCVVTTSEVTDAFGQARVEAQGAPLLLNVRGPAGTLKAGSLRKGDVAVIAGYDRDRGVFLIEPQSPVPSAPPQVEAV